MLIETQLPNIQLKTSFKVMVMLQLPLLGSLLESGRYLSLEQDTWLERGWLYTILFRPSSHVQRLDFLTLGS